MNNQKQQIGSEGPIKKQQLFVNPITLINKQLSKEQVQPQAIETLPIDKLNNFTQFILDTTQSNIIPQSKTKIILKSQPPNKLKNYRTSICPYGIQCRKRLTCNYAHNQSQLRKPYKNRKNPCLRYQKGLCGLGAVCPDYHGNIDLKKKNYKYKVLPCKDWQEKGHCPKGDLCIFLHGQETNQIQQEINEQIQENNDSKMNEQMINNQEKNQEEFNEPTLKQDGKQSQNKASSSKQQIGQIFKTTNKKIIIAKEIVDDPINNQPKQVNQVQNNPNQGENFNIEFNF